MGADTSILVNVHPGHVAYVRYEPGFGGTKVVEVPGAEAAEEIRECKLLPGAYDGRDRVTKDSTYVFTEPKPPPKLPEHLDLQKFKAVVVGASQQDVIAAVGEPTSKGAARPGLPNGAVTVWMYQSLSKVDGKWQTEAFGVRFDASGKVVFAQLFRPK
jgi:hypothetical protein